MLTGRVRSVSGAPVADARLTLLTARQTVAAVTTSATDGGYRFDDVAPGTYELSVTAADGLTARLAVSLAAGVEATRDVVVALSPIAETVTVTAEVGLVQDKDELGQTVTVIPQARLRERVIGGLAEAFAGEAGLSVQQTSPTLGGVFIRGLVASRVSVFVDGVRYTTGAQRGGISTFFNLLEPSGLRSVEVLHGPHGAQYGSDSLGGSVQLLTATAPLTASGFEFHGESAVFGASAVAGFGSATRFAFGTPRFGAVVNLAGRRINTLRAGGGIDSRAAVARFFDLPSNRFYGERQPDTAFTEYAGSLKAVVTPALGQQLVFHYQRGQQDGGKRSDQLLGGDGNLVAKLGNLMLDFGYLRYDAQRLGWFDSLTVTGSFNVQREERINQGGQGNPATLINAQYERTRAVGASLFGSKALPGGHTLLSGADFYRDVMRARAFDANPTTGAAAAARPRVPNGAYFNNYGFFVQDMWDAVPNRLRLSASARYGVASYRARARDNAPVGGRAVVEDDAVRTTAWTFRIGGAWQIGRGFALAANVARGFRPPNMTDLGSLGLQGNGVYEVAAPSVAGRNAFIGTTADATAVSTGLPVKQVIPESSLSYEVSLRYRNGWVDADATGFVTNINDLLTTQTLILPPGAVGTRIGTEIIIAQLPTGAVFVAPAVSPVRVRANFSNARIYGVESSLGVRLTENWSLGGNFTWLHAEDRATGQPPNVEGGTPPPQGLLRLRYQPSRRNWWVEGVVAAAHRQTRLSSLNLDDRRIGATRTRTQIQNFFRRGATVRGFVEAGPDGRFGTADDRLRLTGETLAQIQARVLGTATSAPMFPALPGWVTLNLRGGYQLGERHELFIAFDNILDQNYRTISSGVDAPGRNVVVRYTVRF
ncbi:MAG: TonB-dependent receptor [Acidobacteriota bacterium]|nr:TonB-dependent receptor [Acidobacteriota bacterium]